jgi:hypothetical protein
MNGAGVAFADVNTEAERVKLLKVHHSLFEGRKINVEKVISHLCPK